MGISYTSKAKEDLVQMDWRTRHKIITFLGKATQEKKYSIFQKMHNSEYYKVNFPGHMLICTIDDNAFNVVTVIEKKKLKFPE